MEKERIGKQGFTENTHQKVMASEQRPKLLQQIAAQQG